MQNQEELTLKDYIRILKKRRKLIIWGTIFCLASAAAVSLILPRIYQSQLILEVGKIYLPPAKEKPKQEIEFLEEPDATAEIIRSAALISRVREQLGLDEPLEWMRENLETITFLEDVNPTKMGSPLVELIYQDTPPETVVNVLTGLAKIIIEEHQKKYQDNVGALKNRVVNLEEKISGMQEVVARQLKLRHSLVQRVEMLVNKISDFDDKVAGKQDSGVNQVEAFFIDSYSSNQERIVSTLNEAMAEIDTSVAENREKIGDFKDEITNLRNLSNLCKPTRIRSWPVVPEKPIKPKLGLNLVIGLLVGLALTVFIAFFRENLE
jgi:uncharacterized protein involved in exopolysaccharide biosynthesis